MHSCRFRRQILGVDAAPEKFSAAPALKSFDIWRRRVGKSVLGQSLDVLLRKELWRVGRKMMK
jgi:hypothetical protein